MASKNMAGSRGGTSSLSTYRWAHGKPERLADLAQELVRLRVDVIFAASELPIQAAKAATTRIPIVMGTSADAVTSGLVSSLARPGGNVTGLTTISPELAGKRLQVLSEMIPGLSRVAVLLNGSDPVKVREFQGAQIAARPLGLDLYAVEVRGPWPDFDGAFSKMIRHRVDALLVLGDALLYNHRAQVPIRSAQHRVPTMFGSKEYLGSTGLIAYGPSLGEMFRQAAGYVDKILKGATPASLPVEQPTRFEMVINVKAAKALGLTVPSSILLRADQVIE
jgi:putative ABC transport system substrate-binding protein